MEDKDKTNQLGKSCTTFEKSQARWLRTYDAWAKDKDGNPQTWEEYLTKKDI